jgi:hypothetical protein
MMMVEQQERVSAVLRVRQALALPLYTIALVLEVAASAFGHLAANQPFHEAVKRPDNRWKLHVSMLDVWRQGATHQFLNEDMSTVFRASANNEMVAALE